MVIDVGIRAPSIVCRSLFRAHLVASEIGMNTFGLVIKQLALTAVLVLLIALLLSACASPSDETISSQSSSQSAPSVPGEKMSDDERYSPGAMGAGNIHW